MDLLEIQKYIKSVVNVFASSCPVCKTDSVQDKRYKRRMEGHILKVRRMTNRTITKECKACGMRFSFTWHSFRNALFALGNEQTGEGRSFYHTPAKLIDEIYCKKD